MAKGTLAQKLIKAHLTEGSSLEDKEIALKIDQTLLQDATGTLVMLELEKLNLDRIQNELAAVYVDHNLLQTDHKNPDDHLFLKTASERFGLHYSRPGNGISHVVHMSRLGIPGKSLLGSDSHTPAAGALSMLAIGSGGLDIAMAMAGKAYYVKNPKIWGIYLEGELPDWVSAKNVILELLRRYDVSKGTNKILEYYGPGVKNLSIMDRHVIANMGTELGATTSVFPSDENTKEFLKRNKREKDWQELKADSDAEYDEIEKIDLSKLEPLIAKPSNPDNVVPVSEVEGEDIYQAYIGSSANPGYRDFAVVAEITKGKQSPPHVSYDINISSREIMENLAGHGHITSLLQAGARLHQIGCNGCIGMGQAPASDQNSIRTVPRNFPGRSGTKEDKVWLTSPEVAAASALMGKITDPRNLDMDYPKIEEPKDWFINEDLYQKPKTKEDAKKAKIHKGPNVESLPDIEPIKNDFKAKVAAKMKDNISTDEIMPAGSDILPFRSNIQKMSEFVFKDEDPEYVERTKKFGDNPHIIVAGKNYGQGSSREHAALAPAFLGLKVVLAKSFARIHWQNLISFGVLPIEFESKKDFDNISLEEEIHFDNLHEQIKSGNKISLKLGDKEIKTQHRLSDRQKKILLKGGLMNWLKED